MFASIISTTARLDITAGYENEDQVVFIVSTHGPDPAVEPAGREKCSDGLRRPDPRHDPYLTGRSESGGSDRVGSGRVQTLTGGVGSGRVGLGQEVFALGGLVRIGSGGFKYHRAIHGSIRFSRVGSWSGQMT